MNRFTHTAVALGTGAALASGAFAFTSIAMTSVARASPSTEPTIPATTVDHATLAAKYEQQAAQLEAQADHHAKMAADHRAQIVAGTKQAITFYTMANHCDERAERYRKAALKARQLAESERAMIHRD